MDKKWVLKFECNKILVDRIMGYLKEIATIQNISLEEESCCVVKNG